MTARALLLAGSAALLAVPAAAAVGDFRLPPSDDQPSGPPIVGPVDPERPTPRATPTPTPTARVSPTPAPAPVLAIPPASPTPRATPAARSTGATPSPAATETAAGEAEAPPEQDLVPTGLPTLAAPPATPDAEALAEDEDALPWPWIAGFAALVALLGAGWVWLRRRIAPRGTVLLVPDIEKPRVPPAPQAPEPEAPPLPARSAGPEPAAAAPAPHPLHIAIAPLKLTQTMMNATLSYSLTLTNQGEAPLEGIAVAADLVAAHASLPREALMAFPETELPERHALATLAPGESAELKGELRLPLAQAMPIRQGRAVVFVPLARFRAAAGEAEPRCFTLVVGQPSPGGRLQPMRLDLGPRSTEGLAGRAF